jgi:hypothetical protein
MKAGSAAINSRTTSFTLPSGPTISNSWSGTLTSSTSSFTVKNSAWNGKVSACQSVGYGIIASGAVSTRTVAVTCAAG